MNVAFWKRLLTVRYARRVLSEPWVETRTAGFGRSDGVSGRLFVKLLMSETRAPITVVLPLG
jgi:hypothetical protein